MDTQEQQSLVNMPKVTPANTQVENAKSRKRNNPHGGVSNQPSDPPPPKTPRTRSKTGRALEWNKTINPDNPLS